MRIRTAVADRLRAALAAEGDTAIVVAEGDTAIVVVDHLRTIDNIADPTVVIGVTRVTPALAPQGWLDVTLSAVLIVPKTDPKTGADQLDDTLQDVLNAIDTDTSSMAWTEAVRGTAADDTWPAYIITITTTFNRESE